MSPIKVVRYDPSASFQSLNGCDAISRAYVQYRAWGRTGKVNELPRKGIQPNSHPAHLVQRGYEAVFGLRHLLALVAHVRIPSRKEIPRRPDARRPWVRSDFAGNANS